MVVAITFGVTIQQFDCHGVESTVRKRAGDVRVSNDVAQAVLCVGIAEIINPDAIDPIRLTVGANRQFTRR